MSTPPPPPPPDAPPARTRRGPAELRSINCTQCGAPLTLYGGHKVRSITCSYCGSELDAKDAFRLIRKFTERDRPLVPFELGLTGTVNDVEFTIIGLVQYRTHDGYGWVELALYSPTHGYAWLEQSHNHFVFSRRVWDLPSTAVRPQTKSTFKVRDRTFRVFETYRARVVYVEGELPFVAESGDEVEVLEAICPPYVYSIERTAAEEEYVLGQYVEPEEIYAAFSVPNEPGRRSTVHPAQPYRPSALVREMSRAAGYFLPVAGVLLLLTVLLGWGRPLVAAHFDQSVFSREARSEPFRVEDPGKLLALEMHAPLSNAWAAYDIQVHKDGQPVFSMAKQISYYSGYDGGEHWSEGSRSARAYFKVPEAGNYSLVLTGEGGTGARGNRPPAVDLYVTVKEGIIVSRYFIALVALLALAFVSRYLARWRFESRRWADTDEDDDD